LFSFSDELGFLIKKLFSCKMQSGASADLSGLFNQPVHTLNLTPAHGGASIYQQSSLQVPGVNTPYGIQQNSIPGFQQNQIGGYQQTSMGGYQQNPMGGFYPNHMGGLPAPNNKMGMGMNPFNSPGLGVQIPQMQYNPGVYSVLQVGSGIQAGLRTAPPPPNQVFGNFVSQIDCILSEILFF